VQISKLLNPLTPEPAVTGRDEPRPFFHFWRHPVAPKLASSILNLRSRKTSFQWCPDQGDWPNGARHMHKNAEKRWVKNSEQNFLPLHLAVSFRNYLWSIVSICASSSRNNICKRTQFCVKRHLNEQIFRRQISVRRKLKRLLLAALTACFL